MTNRYKNQKGMAAFIMVSVLIIVITLITIGFAQLMRRSQQSTTNNQLAKAASYAAQSGINDAIAYLKLPGDLKDKMSDKCDKLLNKPPFNQPPHFGDESIKYTCILISPAGDNGSFLDFSNSAAYKSGVIKITSGSPPLKKLLFSWKGSDPNHNKFRGDTNLSDEQAWLAGSYAPMLRLTIYPIPANNKLDDVQKNSRTYFLTPVGSGDYKGVDFGDSALNGSLISVPQNTGGQVDGFGTGHDSTYNFVVDNLGSENKTFYVRLTPLYANADIRLYGQDAGAKQVEFPSAQVVVDVTAKAGNLVKRLQALVNTGNQIIPGDANVFPEYAIRSVDLICKTYGDGVDKVGYGDCPLPTGSEWGGDSGGGGKKCDPDKDPGCDGKCDPNNPDDPDCESTPFCVKHTHWYNPPHDPTDTYEYNYNGWDQDTCNYHSEGGNGPWPVNWWEIYWQG